MLELLGEVVDALSIIVPEDKAVSREEFVKALKELIPRQLLKLQSSLVLEAQLLLERL